VGLDLGPDNLRKNILRLMEKAQELDNFLRIDMESSKATDDTIQIYETCLEQYDKVGTVFQAYLYRTENDIRRLLGPKFNCRLCKGIYREDPAIAIQDRQAINDNFLKLLRLIFENEGYVGIATHDLGLIKSILALIEELQVPNSRFEFQVLYGVPMSGWLKKLQDRGHKVRVYVPFGPEWYAYSIRRLKENPNIVGYVIGNILRKK